MNAGLFIIREAVAIFIAAACLGFAYDTVSPLGLGKPTAVFLSAATPAIAQAPINPTAAPPPTPAPPQTSPAAAPLPAQIVKWPEVKPLLDSGAITLVDTRPSEAFKTGNIPGAVSLPKELLEEQLAPFMASHPKHAPLVFYCQSAFCGVAQAVAAQFTGAGYTDVRVMAGGYVEWAMAEAKDSVPPGTLPSPVGGAQ